MTTSLIYRIKLSYWLAIGITTLPMLANENLAPFKSSTSVEETLRQHDRLPNPAEEEWWAPTGADMRWNNRHLQQLFPTVPVYRDGQVSPLTYQLNNAISQFPVATPDGDLPFTDFLNSEHSTSLGVVILHQGHIVFEHYARMQEYEKPMWWSVSKVFVSSLIAILEARGDVDVSQPVERYLPELKNSEFANISIRDVLDMASGVDCPDGDYSRGTCYYEFEASLGDAVRSDDTPDTPYDMIASMKPGKWAPPGTGFDYSGTNTFVLRWIVERILDMPFHDAVTSEIWLHIGAEGDAAFFAGRKGIALSSGLLAKTRDMARFGLLFTPSYKVVAERPIMPPQYVSTILQGGRPALLERARFGNGKSEGVRHNVYQWDTVFDNDDVFKGGWAGQGLLVNPRKDLVAVYLGYAKDDEFSELPVLPRLRKILSTLYP